MMIVEGLNKTFLNIALQFPPLKGSDVSLKHSYLKALKTF